ncbi:MAG: hypothetical protein ACLFU9_07915 [Candidatus Bathyarchaeia archaeon]
MVEIKEMSYDEKYSGVLGYMNLLDDYCLPIVEKELGAQKVAELKRIWQNEEQPISEDATAQEKFETVYGNWVRKWAGAFNFVSANLGEKGVEKFKYEAIEALKRKSASPALFLLKIVRVLSPQVAFRMLAKQMSYQLQVFTPFSVSELSGNRLVMNMHPCKVLDIPDCEAFCTIGCQDIWARWLEGQFKAGMITNRQGKNCIVTVTPL